MLNVSYVIFFVIMINLNRLNENFRYFKSSVIWRYVMKNNIVFFEYVNIFNVSIKNVVNN